MTSTKQPLVNKEIDDHFTEQYGKQNFLNLFGLNESNWAKMVNGPRKMPNVYKMLMEQDEEIIRLKNALNSISPGTKMGDLLDYLKDYERRENNDLRIEIDRYKSAFRMLQNVEKGVNAIIEKVEK